MKLKTRLVIATLIFASMWASISLLLLFRMPRVALVGKDSGQQSIGTGNSGGDVVGGDGAVPNWGSALDNLAPRGGIPRVQSPVRDLPRYNVDGELVVDHDAVGGGGAGLS